MFGMSSKSTDSIEFIEDGSPHSLLEPPPVEYTNVTIRRAFMVWMLCGQTNKFQDVCNYYHRLELLEEQLPPNKRASSRHHEFNMVNNSPPKSPYLKANFPTLYAVKSTEKKKVETYTNERCDFSIEDLDEIKKREGISTSDVVQASIMIRNYCKSQAITLQNFLIQFKDVAKKSNLKINVNNVVFYIKRRLVAGELQMALLCPRKIELLNKSGQYMVREPTTYTKGKDNTLNDIIQKKLKEITDNMKIENDWFLRKAKREYNDMNDIFSETKKSDVRYYDLNSFINYYNISHSNNDSYKHITVDDLMKTYKTLSMRSGISDPKYTFMNMTKFGRN